MVTLVRATGIEFDYPGPVRALAGVDFEVQAGELVAVLGPNGSGKSTLVRVLSSLVAPRVGKVVYDGADAKTLSTRERARRVAVVPQGLPRIPSLRVDDFVLGGRYAHLGMWRANSRLDRDVVSDALTRVAADECRGRMLSDMSGGQRQRVLVARALAQESRLILLDEPTASLDPEHQILVLDLVRQLADQGRGVVVVTHDLNLASQFADRVVLLDEGRVAAAGSVDEVLCEATLTPVYGERLYFGQLPGAGRPLIVAWRR